MYKKQTKPEKSAKDQKKVTIKQTIPESETTVHEAQIIESTNEGENIKTTIPKKRGAKKGQKTNPSDKWSTETNDFIIIKKIKERRYTDEQKEEIFKNVILLMHKGESVLKALKKYSFSSMAFYKLINQNLNFANEYAHALEIRQEVLFNEIQDIADTETDPNKARVRIDARKWILGRMNPAKYGDKNINIITNNNTLNIEPGERDSKIEMLLSKVNSKDLLND